MNSTKFVFIDITKFPTCFAGHEIIKCCKAEYLMTNWPFQTKTHTQIHTHKLISILVFSNFKPKISRMLILILGLVFWNSKPKSISWANLSRERWILHFAWKLVNKVSWGCDCKNTEEGLLEKYRGSACCSYVFIVTKCKSWSNQKIMLDKWDYSCNQTFSYEKSFASTKLWNKIKTANKPLHNEPFSMSAIVNKRSYLAVERLTFTEWRTTLMVTC